MSFLSVDKYHPKNTSNHIRWFCKLVFSEPPPPEISVKSIRVLKQDDNHYLADETEISYPLELSLVLHEEVSRFQLLVEFLESGAVESMAFCISQELEVNRHTTQKTQGSVEVSTSDAPTTPSPTQKIINYEYTITQKALKKPSTSQMRAGEISESGAVLPMATPSSNLISPISKYVGKAGLVRANQTDYQQIGKLLKGQIGEGGQGTVSMWEVPFPTTSNSPTSSYRVAVKRPLLDEGAQAQLGNDGKDWVKRQMQKEAEITAEMDHPNIIKIYGYSLEGADQNGPVLVTELCQLSSLMILFQNPKIENVMYHEFLAKKLFTDIFQAVNYIHGVGIVHRDLTVRNILLSFQNTVKIADFGLATKIPPKGQVLHTDCGTFFYKAPEVWHRSYTEKCDLWSLGIVLFELLSGGSFPFWSPDKEHSSTKSMFDKIRAFQQLSLEGYNPFTDHIWDCYSNDVKSLIMWLLQPEQKRPTARQVLDHPWLQHDEILDKLYLAELNNDTLLVTLFLANKELPSGDLFLRGLCLNYLTSLLPIENEKKIGELFKLFDEDHDGVLTLTELTKGICNRYPQLEVDTNKLFQLLDFDGDKLVSFSEFATLWSRLTDSKTHEAFKFLDQDHDGKITRQDLSQLGVSSNQWENKWQQLLQVADRNGDGGLDEHEFRAEMKKINQCSSNNRPRQPNPKVSLEHGLYS